MVAITFTLPAKIDVASAETEVVVAAFCTVNVIVADVLGL
jgi:hypothetical protein